MLVIPISKLPPVKRVALLYGQRPFHKGSTKVLMFSFATPCKARGLKSKQSLHNFTKLESWFHWGAGIMKGQKRKLSHTLIDKKLKKLQQILKEMGSILVAYSGGVDSTFLLKVAKDAVDDQVLAVTATSPTYPKREEQAARRMAKTLKVRHKNIKTNELDCADFKGNPPNRCYYCKRELFSKLKPLAQKGGYQFIVEGSNRDDEKDFRPGLKAVKELGIRSPLQEAGLNKEEIRQLSKKLGLSTFDKPSFACLSSRFPYGQSIDLKKLRMVDQGEAYLHTLHFKQARVRYHGSIARIEVVPEDIDQFQDPKVRQAVIKRFKQLGFTYITLDLQGFRSGSMNEQLPSKHT